MTRQSKRAQAADLALLEPEEGFEPSTFRLRVGSQPSIGCCVVPSLQLGSAVASTWSHPVLGVVSGGMTGRMTAERRAHSECVQRRRDRLPREPAARAAGHGRPGRHAPRRPRRLPLQPRHRQHRHRRARLRQAQEVPRRQADRHGGVGGRRRAPPMAAACGRGARRGEHPRHRRQGHHGGLRRPDHPDHTAPDRLLGPGGRLPGAFGGVIRTPIASSVAWCSVSIWSAPDGSGLLTSDGSSIQTDPVGSRRIVWMIKRMIKPCDAAPLAARTIATAVDRAPDIPSGDSWWTATRTTTSGCRGQSQPRRVGAPMRKRTCSAGASDDVADCGLAIGSGGCQAERSVDAAVRWNAGSTCEWATSRRGRPCRGTAWVQLAAPRAGCTAAVRLFVAKVGRRLEVSANPPTHAADRGEEFRPAGIRRSPRRRRPSGQPPPLPHHLQTTGVGWLVAAVVLVALSLVVFADGLRGPAVAVTVVDDAVVGWLAGLDAPGLFPAMRGLAALGSWTAMNVLLWGLLLALLVRRRLRQLLVVLLAWILQGLVIQFLLAPLVQRPRPFGVEFRTDWATWALPSEQMGALVVVLVGILYGLVPEGRWRQIGKWVATGLVALIALARLYVGVEAPTDILVGVAIGVVIPLLGFRWLAPSQVLPVSYRCGRTAHLDVSGARGLAIRQALHDQLGLVVDDVQPFAYHPDQPSSCDATPMPGSLQRITSPLTVVRH